MKPIFNIETLEAMEAKRQTPSILKTRSTHHEIARRMALGQKDVQIAREMGYSQSRLSLLKGDPMFAALVNDYAATRDEAVADIQAMLTHTSVSALAVLQERLEDDPDSITVQDLTKLSALGLDRIGFGATSKNVNVNLNSTASLDEIKARIREESQGRVLSRNQEPDTSQVIALPAIDASFSEAPPRVEGGGANLREEDAQGDLFSLAERSS